MDKFAYDDQPRRDVPGIVFNVLTVVMLVIAVCVAVVVLVIFINPNTGINLFPPPTLPAVAEMPTSTPTALVVLPPTWTAAPTQIPTITNTPRPTDTPEPTRTPLPTSTPIVLFTATLTPTRAPVSSAPFVLQGSGPVAIPNIAYPDLACSWFGVAGNVVDMSGAPVTQLIVTLGGTISGKQVHSSGVLTTLTGLSRNYGEAGFEFVLGSKPVVTRGTLWIQLGDQAGLVLSDKVYFDTYDDCQKNLIVINFKQVR